MSAAVRAWLRDTLSVTKVAQVDRVPTRSGDGHGLLLVAETPRTRRELLTLARGERVRARAVVLTAWEVHSASTGLWAVVLVAEGGVLARAVMSWNANGSDGVVVVPEYIPGAVHVAPCRVYQFLALRPKLTVGSKVFTLASHPFVADSAKPHDFAPFTVSDGKFARNVYVERGGR